jgi:hypothetical protein
MPPRHQLISAKHLVGRLRLLPDEIYQATQKAIDESYKLAVLKARVEDLKSELLTQEDSPINGKNQEIREAQLHERLKIWDLPLADQERTKALEVARANRLTDELESLFTIEHFITGLTINHSEVLETNEEELE